MSAPSPETVFLDDSGIRVTNARFATPNSTVVMNGVTAVSKVKTPANQTPALIVFVAAAGLLFAGTALNALIYFVGAGAVACVAVALFFVPKPIYEVHITSSSGKQKAYQSKDEAFIDRLIRALNDAIIHRG